MASYLVARNDAQRTRQRRTFNLRAKVSSFTDSQLMANYRMDRHSITEIINIVSPDLITNTQRSFAISPETQVLVALRFFSKGGFFSEIAHIHGVSRSTVCRVIHNVSDSINRNFENITFPRSDRELRVVKEGFHGMHGFPRVIGCVDGTLVPIIAPNGVDETSYVCRKQYHAINVQAVCDKNLRFLNVTSKWPGATHDATVFGHSSLGQYLEQNHVDGWLLGDSGYPCRPWLLTPMTDPKSRAEERYNSCHCRTRNTIERAFGVLKSRFRCLHKTTGCLPFTPKKCANVIMACCHLHNFCIDRRIPTGIQDVVVDDVEVDDIDGVGDLIARNDGFGVRRALIMERFSR